MEKMEKMENIKKQIECIDYEMALNRAYEFIKSKGFEIEYKMQLNNQDQLIIEGIDKINKYTGF